MNGSHLRPLLAALVLGFTSACAPGRTLGSYSPIGASSQYGDQTEDGVIVNLSLTAAEALDIVEEAFLAEGYALMRPERRLSRMGVRSWGDTTMTVRAELMELQVPEEESIIVLTATYGVGRTADRVEAVVQKPGETDPMFLKLKELGAAMRERRP